jgi:hypothetical protein
VTAEGRDEREELAIEIRRNVTVRYQGWVEKISR